MPRRGRRGLTQEERSLWDQVRATAEPLRPDLPTAPEAPASARPLAPEPSAPPERRAPVPAAKAAPPPTATAAPESAPLMDRRRLDKLRRGRLQPEARIDLHGMTAARAHSALTGFIQTAHAQGRRLVLVITGKGRAPDDAIAPQRHGILHHSVPHWLAAPPLVTRVLEVVPAHQRHGGAGAYYVYLRRLR